MFKYTDSVFSLKYCSRSKILQMSISWLDYWQCSHNPTSCGYVQPFTHHTCSISVQSKPSNLADLQRWCLHILHPLSVPFSQGLVSTKVPFYHALFVCFAFLSHSHFLLAPPSTELTSYSIRPMISLRILMFEIGSFVFFSYGYHTKNQSG